MRNHLIAVAAICLFTPPACLTPAAVAKSERDANRTAQSAPAEQPKKTLTTKGGTLLNSDATPEQANATIAAARAK